jgi:imidazoleglycerol-phosphate dehydratase
MSRTGAVTRTTRETDVAVTLSLDGAGRVQIETGAPFFDHLLGALARHGRLDLTVRAAGDLAVDAHHTVEDVGIVLGQALRQAAGTGEGIARFASLHLPMDDALVLIALDVSGRPFLHFDVMFPTDRVGAFPLELVEEFLRALATHAGLTLHVVSLHGRNGHHLAEAVFKGLGVAIARAMAVTGQGIPSTKGVL